MFARDELDVKALQANFDIIPFEVRMKIEKK